MSETWTTSIVVTGCLVLLAVVAVDRRRLQKRLDATEGALTGLRLDLAAAHERVDELHSYLSRHDNWAPGKAAPSGLADGTVPDRWSPARGAASTADIDSSRTAPASGS